MTYFHVLSYEILPEEKFHLRPNFTNSEWLADERTNEESTVWALVGDTNDGVACLHDQTNKQSSIFFETKDIPNTHFLFFKYVFFSKQTIQQNQNKIKNEWK